MRNERNWIMKYLASIPGKEVDISDTTDACTWRKAWIVWYRAREEENGGRLLTWVFFPYSSHKTTTREYILA